MREFIVAQQPQPEIPIETPTNTLLEPEVLTLGVVALGLIIFSKMMGQKKGVLASANWAGRREKINALRKAQKQRQKPRIDRLALYAGIKPMTGWKPYVTTLFTGDPPTLPLPDLNRHTLVLGATGCGKTTTVINPVIRDAIRQGHPLIVFDPKGDLAQIHAAYAEARGYEHYYLAPGKPHTDCFNILEWMRSPVDSSRAEQMAKTINRNANVEGTAKTDPFFGPSGDIVVRSILMLAKSSPYPDLLMAKRLLALSDLPDRLKEALEAGKLDPWIENSFQQFLSGKSSDKTIAGIQATAGLVFDGFTRSEFLNAFIGKSTIPLEFTGKKILFVQPAMGQEDVIMPLLATSIEILVEENFEFIRSDPLLLVLDEFPLGYYPRMARWLSFRRSNGLAAILAAQNFAQIRQRYGADNAQTIVSNTKTQFYFDPNDNETAEAVSKRCGETEVHYKQFSRSYGKGGGSRSHSEQIQKVPLKPAHEVTKMGEAEFILFAPAYASKGKSSIPVHQKYLISEEELNLEEQMKEEWKHLTYPRLCQRAELFHLSEEERTLALSQRAEAAEDLLPFSEASPPITKTDRQSSDYGVLSDEREKYAYFA